MLGPQQLVVCAAAHHAAHHLSNPEVDCWKIDDSSESAGEAMSVTCAALGSSSVLYANDALNRFQKERGRHWR